MNYVVHLGRRGVRAKSNGIKVGQGGGWCLCRNFLIRSEPQSELYDKIGSILNGLAEALRLGTRNKEGTSWKLSFCRRLEVSFFGLILWRAMAARGTLKQIRTWAN